MQILDECISRDREAKGDVQVVIGSENRTPSLQNCTLIRRLTGSAGSSAVGTLIGPRPDADRIR